MLERSRRRLDAVDWYAVADRRKERIKVSLCGVVNQRQQLSVGGNFRYLAGQHLLHGFRDLSQLVVEPADDHRCRLGNEGVVLPAALSHTSDFMARGQREMRERQHPAT
jgi:hypothetical protein